MQPTIPKLKSRYIPVHNIWYAINDEVHWWRENSPFYYPSVLINLQTIDSDKIKPLMNDDTFLLTDSGGFQVISGQCKLTWEESLKKQVELNASKIFSFDTPPVKRVMGGSKFVYHEDSKVREIIKSNFEIALKQSEYLKNNYPNYLQKFCYILHAKSREQLNYNIDLIEQEIGMDNYPKYFPGGIVYAAKTDDIMFLALSSCHANKYFIKKGMYVHFLGIRSFNRMIILIRNEITTFDSSNALNGASRWSCYNPIFANSTFGVNKLTYPFYKNFCCCPVCSKVDYVKLLKENEVMVGRWFIAHNVWIMLQSNCFLDSIRKDVYTKTIKEIIKPKENIMKALEFIDDYEKLGFNMSCEKYKFYFKKDETKQKSLF